MLRPMEYAETGRSIPLSTVLAELLVHLGVYLPNGPLSYLVIEFIAR